MDGHHGVRRVQQELGAGQCGFPGAFGGREAGGRSAAERTEMRDADINLAQIERAADAPQALALLLMAPEFQRR